MKLDINDVKFDEHGLVPAIVQDAETREVLTLAYMNEESLRRTIESKQTWFWSRSRSALWHKGQTSGNTQQVVDLILDCDQDAIVVLVNPAGPACHTGARSCFQNQSNQVDEAFDGSLELLYRLIQKRKAELPQGSYTSYLFIEGLDKILKKLGEETAETIVAAKNKQPAPLIAESSDLIYHLLVLLVESGITLEQIHAELKRRRTK